MVDGQGKAGRAAARACGQAALRQAARWPRRSRRAAQVHTINKKELGRDPIATADKFFTDHPGIHKLLVVDDQDRLHGLFTMSDVERITQERNAQFKPARDAHFRLLCGAAVSATRNAFGELDRERILAHVGGAGRTRRGRGGGLDRARPQPGCGRYGADAARRVSQAADHRRQRDQRGGGGVSGRLRRQRDQSGPGSRLDLHDAHRGRGGHPATDRALSSLRGRRRRSASRILADGGITKSGDIVKALTLARRSFAAAYWPAARKRRGR